MTSATRPSPDAWIRSGAGGRWWPGTIVDSRRVLADAPEDVLTDAEADLAVFTVAGEELRPSGSVVAVTVVAPGVLHDHVLGLLTVDGPELPDGDGDVVAELLAAALADVRPSFQDVELILPVPPPAAPPPLRAAAPRSPVVRTLDRGPRPLACKLFPWFCHPAGPGEPGEPGDLLPGPPIDPAPRPVDG